MNRKFLSRMLPYIMLGLFFVPFNGASASASTLHVSELRVEYLKNPVGIDQKAPRFFWQIGSEAFSTMQVAYQIRVSLDADFAESGKYIWDTQRVESGNSVHIAYEGPELQSATSYYWQVRVWDNHGNESDWSETAYWEMGLLHSSDWQAVWIQPAWEEDYTKPQPCPMFRNLGSLSSDKPIVEALEAATTRLLKLEPTTLRTGSNNTATTTSRSQPSRRGKCSH